jgi:HEAT repeat protein
VGRSDLVDAAKQLLLRRDRDALADVLAATILGNDSNPAAIALYRILAKSKNSGAAVIAVEGLFSIDPAHLTDLTDELLRHKDVSIRRIAARALVSAPSADNILALTTLLSDVNPSLRMWTAERLVEFGQQEEWNDIVIGETASLIESASWRGIEQAVVVLTRLDHKPIAPQLVSLLDHERPEVFVTAAWALREIQVQETLPPMLAKAQSRFQDFKANAETMPIPPGDHVAQLCQLFQAFGRMKFREAEPLLREFVPKIGELGDETRASACWALGYIREDDAPDELVQQLIQRLMDQNPENPELLDVRIMCAVSLGRMKSPTAVEPLQLVARRRGPDDSLGQACGWALEKSTGQPRREPRPRFYSMTSYFLTPILD